MSIKLALLKSGETIISDAKELISDEKICGYLFNSPHVIDVVDHRSGTYFLSEQKEVSNGDVEIVLTPWIVLTEDKQIPVPPDWIVTIVEPIQSVVQMYEEKLNG